MINRIVKGDLIKLAKEGKFDAICHGCNCFNAMSAGIAKQIKNEFPEALIADKSTKHGDREKLGTYSTAITSYHAKAEFENTIIINAYTQFDYRGYKPVNYSAIATVFKSINDNFKGATLGIPKIGAGLAGGDWDLIKKIINDVTPDINITLVEFDG